MSKNYPSSWGQPPKIQTMDMVPLPLGGTGSSTLRNWQNQKIQEFGMPPAQREIDSPLPRPRGDATGYGEWIDLPPDSMRTMDFRDQDGDNIDDRYQAGPGMTPGAATIDNRNAKPGDVVRKLTPEEIKRRIEANERMNKNWKKPNDGPRNIPGFTQGPLTGTPEPAWGGATRGPESLRWLEWARQNDVTQFNQGGSRPPMRPGGEDWLNGTVGTPWRPPQTSPALDYASMQISSPVDGINFSNKKELNKQLAKLDQDLRNARAQNDGASIQRLEAKQQAANDVVKAMKVGYSPDEAKQFARREAEIRQAQQRTASEVALRDSQNAGLPFREGSDAAAKPKTPAPELNRLANNAATGGKAGASARAALEQRAAAGDPQAANALQELNSRPQTQASPQPATATTRPSTQTSSRQQSQPRKEPTAEEMASEIDKRNRAQEMAAAKAKQRRGPTPEERRQMQDAAARAQMQNAIATAKANPNNPKTQADAAKAYQQGQQTLMANQAAREREGGGRSSGGGGGGGGGRRGGGGGRGLTAKERNDLADKRASQAAEREDKKRLEESYREKYGSLSTPSSRKFWDDVEKRKAGQPSSGASVSGSRSGNNLDSSGLTANQQDYLSNPQRLAENAEAYRKRAENEKDPEKKARLNRLADSTQEMANRAGGSSNNPMANIKPLSNQSGSTPATPASDPADIGVDIGGPNTSVPGTTWQSTPSASTGGTWRTIDGRKIRIA